MDIQKWWKNKDLKNVAFLLVVCKLNKTVGGKKSGTLGIIYERNLWLTVTEDRYNFWEGKKL